MKIKFSGEIEVIPDEDDFKTLFKACAESSPEMAKAITQIMPAVIQGNMEAWENMPPEMKEKLQHIVVDAFSNAVQANMKSMLRQNPWLGPFLKDGP